MRLGRSNNQTSDLAAAFEASSCAMMLTAASPTDNLITHCNPAFARLTGYSRDEVIGRDPRFLQGSGSDRRVIREIRRAIASGQPIARDVLNYRKDGRAFWNHLVISPIRGDGADTVGFVAMLFEQAQTFAQPGIRDEAIQLKEILRHVPGYVYRRSLMPGGSMEMVYFSPSINSILGEPEHLKIDAAIFFSHVHADDRDGLLRALHVSAETLSLFRSEYRLVSTAGVRRWFRAEAAPRRLATGEILWDGFALDVTHEKSTQAEVRFLASHDHLTGVTNRARFRQVLAEAMEALSPDECVIALMLLDVDDFQHLNESRGHAVADEVLRELGRRFTKFVAPVGGSVARMGGNEFALLIPAHPRAKSMDDLATSLNRLVSRPIVVGDQTVTTAGSVGVAIFPQPEDARLSAAADGCAELMRQAALALQAAKRDDRGGFLIYAPEMDDRFRQRVALRESLATALAENQFELHYQPIISLATGGIVGAEALVRWNHPTLGLKSPGEFIPIAEASGQIVALGEWIVNEAFRQAQTWRAMGLEPRVSINLSGLQLRRDVHGRAPDFVALVERALALSGADPRQFEFELTESVLIASSDETLKVLNALKSQGFRISIDDFGVGHSTFRYLRDFPIDAIKIDRSFVSRIGVDPADELIIRAMVELSRGLGITAVAEGIETAPQHDFLCDLGCDLGQGYLFSMPLRAEDFTWMIERDTTLPARQRTA